MSDLIVIAYDGEDTADRARQRLFELQKEQLISLDDAVVVTKDAKGKIKLHQAVSTTGVGATSGALWGGLVGLLFLQPLLGMALGAATGAAAGSLTDIGVDDDLMRRLGQKLDEGAAALILLVRDATPDKVLPRMEEFGGEVMQTSLSDEGEQRLRDALAHQGAGAPAG